MKLSIHVIYLMTLSMLIGCGDIFKDTDLDPIYYVECDIDGEPWRAQTNNDAWMGWTGIVSGEYYVTGQTVETDQAINMTLFEQLGESKIVTGTNVNSYLTDIAYFNDNKTYNGVTSGGSGCVTVTRLTDDEVEGTFEGTLVNIRNSSESKEITNGVFYVKTR